MNSTEILAQITKHLEDMKALDIESFDLRDKTYIADYVVVATGTSTAHLSGISDRVYIELKKDKLLPLGVEGKEAGTWILLDYNEVILHLFVEEERAKYKIEELFTAHPSGTEDAEA